MVRGDKLFLVMFSSLSTVEKYQRQNVLSKSNLPFFIQTDATKMAFYVYKNKQRSYKSWEEKLEKDPWIDN